MKQGLSVTTRVAYAGLLALALGTAGAAEARPRCPEGMWLSQGSCCAVGTEYVPSKNQCMQVRPERRCVAGHYDDCLSAGRELESRGAAGASYSAELYRFACEEGYAPACRSLGSLYQRGLGLDRDEARARVLYEESCDGGDAAACTVIAKLLLDEGSDGLRAEELLTQACHRGDADACDVYGRRLSADPEQLEHGALYLERACAGGVGSACRSLVDIERRRQTIAPERERELLERACSGADAVSCTLLGDALHAGVNGPQNDAQAAQRYRSACEAGHGEGCLRLGELTFKGDGVKRDLGHAAELFGKACKAGVPLACERASSMKLGRDPGSSVSRAP